MKWFRIALAVLDLLGGLARLVLRFLHLI